MNPLLGSILLFLHAGLLCALFILGLLLPLLIENDAVIFAMCHARQFANRLDVPEKRFASVSASRPPVPGTIEMPLCFFLHHLTEGGFIWPLRKETGTLIGSDKVEGTAVYGPDDQKIGSIERVMIEKTSGRVSYAVLGFGGFLGIGNDHYPLPWHSLKYDTTLGGYRTGITVDKLNGAPKYADENNWNWSDPTRPKAVDDYYSL